MHWLSPSGETGPSLSLPKKEMCNPDGGALVSLLISSWEKNLVDMACSVTVVDDSTDL